MRRRRAPARHNLITRPLPSKITNISPVAGIRRAVSTRSLSPSESAGSMDSPRTRSTRKAPEVASYLAADTTSKRLEPSTARCRE